MAQPFALSPQPVVIEPWVPHIPPRTRSWQSSRGRPQELRSEPAHQPESQTALIDQAIPQISDHRTGKHKPILPALPWLAPLLPQTQASNDWGTAAWKRQRLGRQVARCQQNTLGTEGDPTGNSEPEEQLHPYSAAQDWEGRFQHHTRAYQSTARVSAEWSPWQCLAGSFREEQPVQTFKQLLFTRQTGDQAHALEHLSVSTDGVMEGSRFREDGNFEHSWYTSMQANQEADGFCQEVPHTTGPLRRRALAATPHELASVHMGLPLRQHLQRPTGSRAPRTSDYMLGVTFHNDDGRSWNIAARYSLDTCQLAGFHTERDFAMGEADPSQPVQFSELPNRGMQPAGKRLDGRAASWLPGRWNGSATSLTFDEDGNIWRRKKHSCIWTPPNNHRRDFLYGLWTLPDACYVFAPLQLPQSERSIPMEGVRVECGVMPSPTTLKRAVILFDSRGRLGKLRFETYQWQQTEATQTIARPAL